jgi:sigma-B regulation protein RsbU (phosphoserine phosphatase)
VIYPINDPLDTAPCGFLSFTDDGTIAAVNITLAELLEYGRSELVGQKIETILPLAGRIFYQTHFFPLLKMHGKVEEVYFSLRTKSRSDIPMLVNGVRRKFGEESVNECIFIPIRQRIQYEDEILQAKKRAEVAIQARKQAEMELRQQYERALSLKQVAQEIHRSLELPRVFALATGELRQCFGVDRVAIFQFHAGTNFTRGEFIAESVDARFEPTRGKLVSERCFGERHAAAYEQGRIQTIADVDRETLEDCYRQLLREFQVRANLVYPLLNAGELWGLLCVHQCSAARVWQAYEIDFIGQVANQLAIAIQQADLFEKLCAELAERKRTETELQRSNEELSRATGLLTRLVNTDGLTGIANRRCFDERLEAEWKRLRRNREPLSLLLFDVDFFKRYNDTYGHQFGDECLVSIARSAALETRRPADLVARYGGEEFVVLLPETDIAGAIETAQRIHRAVASLNIPHRASDASDLVTVSLGIATIIPNGDILPTRLIEEADRALYLAKQRGRNQSAVFTLVPDRT